MLGVKIRILLTGSTGLLGHYLVGELLNQGHDVYALVRDPHKCPEGCIPVEGDVTKHDLGISDPSSLGLDEAWHAAGITNLSKKARKVNFEVNAGGARNVVDFVLAHGVKRVVHVSTAYTDTRRNPYEESKFWAEAYIRELSTGFSFHSPVPVLIIRPSILVAEQQEATIPEGVQIGAFYKFVARLARVHTKIESMRKKVETKLHLPPWDFTFRIRGNPEGRLNLVPVDWVAKVMVRLASAVDGGTFDVVNPAPPSLQQLADWVGEVVKLRLKVTATAILWPFELAFTAAMDDFLPYLECQENLSLSSVEDALGKIEPPQVDKEFIQRTVREVIFKR